MALSLEVRLTFLMMDQVLPCKLIITHFGTGDCFSLKFFSEQAYERLLKCCICLFKVRLTPRPLSITKWEKFR